MTAKQPRRQDYLAHMLAAIRQARSYVEGLARDDFLAERKTQQAVILNLMILGEAASQLMAECPELPDQHPEIPWKQMKGMRNRMAHGYFEIDLNTVWDTVQDSLPKLERQIIALI
jgi:uncharacterized protein with HEPN domain